MSPFCNTPALVNTKGDDKWSEGDAFTGVLINSYWSNTEFDSNFAWSVSTDYGQMNYNSKATTHYVWPVRSSFR